MKNNLLASAILFGALSAAVSGAPLTATTAVHTKPDAASPTITYLKAGSEPTPASGAITPAAGWAAVQLTGPFECYVQTKDLTKQLAVIPGTALRLTPDTNGPVLKTADRADKTTITGLRGRWTQLSLAGPLVGYIRSGATPASGGPMAAAPAAATAPAPAPGTGAVTASGSNLAGQPALASSAGADAAQLPRQLTGKFASARSLLHRHPPFPWELVDNSGRRFAYLDVSNLLLTDPIESFTGHFVVVFGAAQPTRDGKDIVIRVESMQLLLK